VIKFDRIAVVGQGKLIVTFVYSVIILPSKIDVCKDDKIVIQNLLDMLFPRRCVAENIKIVKH